MSGENLTTIEIWRGQTRSALVPTLRFILLAWLWAARMAHPFIFMLSLSLYYLSAVGSSIRFHVLFFYYYLYFVERSFHPWLPLVATSSGQRHVRQSDLGSDSSDSETESSSKLVSRENSVKLWWAGDMNHEAATA